MRFWWVNQNKTYREEIGGGYMWSPKCNNNGTRNQFYENMKLVNIGDVVFSFYRSQIQRVGFVQEPATSAKKPSEFGRSGDYWSNQGWMVPVKWGPVLGFYPRDHMHRPLLPKKYSPIRLDGGGNQIYLAEISQELANKLRLLGGLSDGGYNIIRQKFHAEYILDANASTKYKDEIEAIIQQDEKIGETEKEALVKSRRGQGKFRQRVASIERSCRVSGLADKRFLIASHIKSWADCETNEERLDANNGLLLSPNVDKLFDNGYISFKSDGNFIVSSQIDEQTLIFLGISNGNIVPPRQFNDQQKIYMKYHRENVFKA